MVGYDPGYQKHFSHKKMTHSFSWTLLEMNESRLASDRSNWKQTFLNFATFLPFFSSIFHSKFRNKWLPTSKALNAATWVSHFEGELPNFTFSFSFPGCKCCFGKIVSHTSHLPMLLFLAPWFWWKNKAKQAKLVDNETRVGAPINNPFASQCPLYLLLIK